MSRTPYAIGALVGSAVADAIGAPFEFLPPGTYRQTFPSPVLTGRGEMCGGGEFNWKPGEFTDDTQMAVVLAESLVAHQGFDADDLWLRWRTWAAGARDVGIHTREVLSSDSHAGTAEAVHRQSGRSAGNGSVMRNTPVGLWTADQPLEAVATLAEQQVALTHFDPCNAHGAALHAAMIRAGIRGEDIFEAIDAMFEVLPPAARTRYGPLLAAGWQPDTRPGNGAVFTALAEAVWAVRHASSFEEAVVNAVDLGRDADTVACIAGGIAGARWGVQSIPSRWTTYVHGKVSTPEGNDRCYDLLSLRNLARQLMRSEVHPDTPDEPAAGPTRVHAEFPLYAANRLGARNVPPDWRVISLCPPSGAGAHSDIRREVYLIDKVEPHHNPQVLTALRDVVDTIDAWLTEAPHTPIVVHCHGGRSRTAFVLKAWAMRRYGWTEQLAHEWLTETWSRTDRWNCRFHGILRDEWPVVREQASE